MQATWLGHSTFEWTLDNGETIVTDPWTEGNPKYPKEHEFRKIDSMIVSHGHFDHFHDVVRLAQQFKPQVVAIFEITKWLESKNVENTNAMNKGGSLKVNSVTYTMTEALHSSCIIDADKINVAGEPVGYVLELPDGRRVYFAGDTAVFSDMALIRELYQPEIAFLPIGSVFTMGPREAALAVRLLQPKVVVPMHYGTFPQLTGTPEDLEKQLRAAGQTARMIVFEPGQTIKL